MTVEAPASDPAALAALARASGVQRSYTDVGGRRRRASRGAVAAVLRALGHEVDEGGRGAAEALRAMRAAHGGRLAEPVAVAWDGTARVDVAAGAGRLEWTVALEQGGELRGGDSAGAPGVRLTGLPPGYHSLHLERAGRAATVLLLSAPRRAYLPPGRSWGVFLPLYALPGPFGPGDLTLLRLLLGWTARLGGEMVGTTPLFAAFLDRPFDPSPYAPVSRLYWNELYADPAAAPELEGSAEARRLLAAAPETKGPLVDYRAAMAAKRRVFEALLESLAGARLEAFERHRRGDADLAAYAGFRARCEREGGGWHAWSGEAASIDAGEPARYHAYVQWLCREQLAPIRDDAAGPYLDMPLGVHPSGYDTWRFGDVFAEGASVGAPPDDFFLGGQDWGFPPLHPARLREQGHAYVIACVRELFRHAAAARIDHVMGMHRTYWVPRGFGADQGVYVHHPAGELYAVLCIESHRFRTVVVGEDLGTVPGQVRRAMSAHGVLRSFVLEAEAGSGGDPLDHVPRAAMVGMNTHDMPTFAGFWESAGKAGGPRRSLEDAVRRRGHATAGGPRVLDACLEELAGSDAHALMINLEDMWWERDPQNVPGTTEHPNWRRRARYGVAELDDVPGLAARLRRIADLRRREP